MAKTDIFSFDWWEFYCVGQRAGGFFYTDTLCMADLSMAVDSVLYMYILHSAERTVRMFKTAQCTHTGIRKLFDLCVLGLWNSCVCVPQRSFISWPFYSICHDNHYMPPVWFICQETDAKGKKTCRYVRTWMSVSIGHQPEVLNYTTPRYVRGGHVSLQCV